jgi:hypothetical protein
MKTQDRNPKKFFSRVGMILIKLDSKPGNIILFIILMAICAAAVQLVNIIFNLWGKQG